MKEKSYKISTKKGRRTVTRAVIFFTLGIFMSQSESYGCAQSGTFIIIKGSDIKPPMQKSPRRLFKTLLNSKQNICNQSNKVSSNSVTPIEITYQDMITAYDINNDLEYYSSDEEYSYEMNIGASDLVNPQHWEMPDFEEEDYEYDYGEGILPSETPYLNYFPTSTHCKFYEYDEGKYYEYYEFTEQSIKLIGAVDIDNEEEEVDEIDLLMAPLPLNLNSVYVTGDSIHFDGYTSIGHEEIAPFGFGTLTTPDGDVEVLVLLDTYHLIDYSDDMSDYDEEAGAVLIFISKEGHQLNVWLEEGTELEGDVDAEWIEYTHIVNNANKVGTKDPAPSDFALFQNYPDPFNPSTTIQYALKQAGHVSLKVFDQMGREVGVLADEQKPAGTYEVLFDGSLLPSGSYYCQLQAGDFKATQKMMLMK